MTPEQTPPVAPEVLDLQAQQRHFFNAGIDYAFAKDE